TVFAVIAVVAHHKITIRRHDDLILALKGVVILLVVFRTGLVIDIVELAGFPWWLLADSLQLIFVVVIFGSDAMLGHDLAVHYHAISLDADAIAGYADDSLYVVRQDGTVVGPIVTLRIVRIAGILEDDDIATFDVSLRQKRKRHTRRKDEF